MLGVLVNDRTQHPRLAFVVIGTPERLSQEGTSIRLIRGGSNNHELQSEEGPPEN
jgi:hypothetical protein